MIEMKYQTPSNLMLAMEAKIKEHGSVIQHRHDPDCLYNFVDRVQGSNFFFKIFADGKKHVGEFKPGNFAFEWRPADGTVVHHTRSQGKVDVILDQFNAWIKLVKTYSTTKTVHDDPIVENYEKEFEAKFSFMPEENELEPFNLDQQLFLDAYVVEVNNKLELFKLRSTGIEQATIVDIQLEAKQIQSELTRESKKEIRRRLIRLWAKTRKFSLEALREIFIEVASEIAKKLMLG